MWYERDFIIRRSGWSVGSAYGRVIQSPPGAPTDAIAAVRRRLRRGRTPPTRRSNRLLRHFPVALLAARLRRLTASRCISARCSSHVAYFDIGVIPTGTRRRARTDLSASVWLILVIAHILTCGEEITKSRNLFRSEISANATPAGVGSADPSTYSLSRSICTDD